MQTSSDHENIVELPTLLSLSALIERRAVIAPDASVIEADGAAPLLNHGLLEVSECTRRALRSAGLDQGARVALTAPAGPEFAAAAATIAAHAICAPLNPALGSTMWREMLDYMRIDALVVSGDCAAAREAAVALSLPVLELIPTPDQGAGSFTLTIPADSVPQEKVEQAPSVDDIAFILPTSGTTSRPKVVQLTHLNIAHSGRNTGASLALTAADRLIGVLPIHHAHGLISGLMATLHAGASVIMVRGFSADAFFDHLTRFRPTWLTAVPAIHQAILDAAPRHQAALAGHNLRLVRSASAPLPVARYQELADLFGAPVIETYGMTEAASQVASNPLGLGRQKPGSVGVSAGPEIMVLAEDGTVAAPNTVGEVALRGPNMTRGYDDEAATAAAFTSEGWFRTGDLGRLDEEGYLFLVSRLKEVINRGGEKILPQRIEAALTKHPAVTEAAAFGAPHDRLGEEVAAAVVMAQGAEFDEALLRAYAFASGDLSDAEAPRLIIRVDALPKTVTGKVQRALLADHLGLRPARTTTAEPAASDDEAALIAIWCKVLGVGSIGATDDFFHLGGDSLMAVEIALHVAEAFDATLTLRSLFDAPTPRALARIIRDAGPDTAGFKISKIPAGTMQKPASISQDRILALEASMPGFPTHSVPIVYYIDGSFDPAIFEKALRTLIARHEPFRSVFRQVGDEWKAIPTAAVNLRLKVEDWSWAGEPIRDGFINDALESEIWDVLDPTIAAPLRARMLRFNDESHALMMVFHHIATDNWTIRTFVEEVFQHYTDLVAGTVPSRPRPAFQFADFANWQRGWVQTAEAGHQRGYWQNRLGGLRSIFPETEGLATPSVGFGSGRAEIAFPEEVVEALTHRAQAAGATLFMGLVAALKVFLHQQFGKGDITIVVPTANRNRPATGDTLGLISNNVALRTNAAASGFDAALAAVREAVLDAGAHQEVPFEVVVDDLNATDPHAGAAISDIYLSFVDHFEPKIAGSGLSISRMNHDQRFETPLPVGSAKLMFLLKLVDGVIIGSCVFKPHLLSHEDADELMHELTACIMAITNDT